jgi:4,5-DOPA dioxygenase extradiol
LLAAVQSVIGKQSPDKNQQAPALFIGHGSPMNAIDDNDYTRGWAAAGVALTGARAILSISAHWETRSGTYITSNAKPRTIYDMRGFPEALYKVRYDAPGNPQLATQLVSTPYRYPIATSATWGLDHGSWSVLVHLQPKADIPVLQLSLNSSLSLLQHYELGRQLAELRERGIAILGSGNIVHNLRLRRSIDDPYDWASEFDERIAKLASDRNFIATTALQDFGGIAKLAHPTTEHYLPLLYVLGALGKNEEFQWFNQGFTKSTLGMRSLLALG